MKLEEQWGLNVGQCAWCLTAQAITEYKGQQSNGEWVMYQVCLKCSKEFN